MRNFKHIFVSTVISSFVLLSACTKEDCEDDNKVYTKKGLDLSGAQEVPVRDTKAYGKADVSYDKKTKMLKYDISWFNLTGVPTGSHIHGSAPRGVNAPIKHDFFSLIPKTPSGTFSNSVMVDGVAIKEDSLLLGFYYLNIHTPTFPGGEIRGQIEFK